MAPIITSPNPKPDVEKNERILIRLKGFGSVKTLGENKFAAQIPGIIETTDKPAKKDVGNIKTRKTPEPVVSNYRLRKPKVINYAALSKGESQPAALVTLEAREIERKRVKENRKAAKPRHAKKTEQREKRFESLVEPADQQRMYEEDFKQQISFASETWWKNYRADMEEKGRAKREKSMGSR